MSGGPRISICEFCESIADACRAVESFLRVREAR